MAYRVPYCHGVLHLILNVTRIQYQMAIAGAREHVLRPCPRLDIGRSRTS